MDNSIIGFIVFIAAYVIGRLVGERGLKKLTEEERGRLLGGFSKYRVFSLLGVIVLVVIHYSFRALAPDSRAAGLPFFVVALVFYLLLSSLYSYRKLKSLGMPDAYINNFLLSTLIQYAGIFVFFGFLIDSYE